MSDDPKGHRNFYNTEPDNSVNHTMPKDVVKADFARRLNREIVKRGWNQSELWRRSEAHKPKGAPGLTRDLVSKYIGAKSLPTPVNLQIIVDTLGVKREELLPIGAAQEAGDISPALSVNDLGNGNVWLKIDQAAPWTVALKVMALLKGEDAV